MIDLRREQTDDQSRIFVAPMRGAQKMSSLGVPASVQTHVGR